MALTSNTGFDSSYRGNSTAQTADTRQQEDSDEQLPSMGISTISDAGSSNMVEYVQIQGFEQLPEASSLSGKIWKLVPASPSELTDDSVYIIGPDTDSKPATGVAVSGRYQANDKTLLGVPNWAQLLLNCEKIGHYYRGWLSTEHDLEIVLTLHRQQTQSVWGTRQSPAVTRDSVRMMWKSQYVPFDGIPFINCGARAVTMECQFGPRRKSHSKNNSQPTTEGYKQACPARIYVKRVRKYPEFAIDTALERRKLKVAMDQSLQQLKRSGFHVGGRDRIYVQLPTELAHEYHLPEVKPSFDMLTRTFSLSRVSTETNEGGARVAPQVAAKIREVVSSGVKDVLTIRRRLRHYVEKELFIKEEQPDKHDLSFFPTVNDLQNHIHQAIKDIKSGKLAEKAAGSTDIDEAQPCSVTVSLLSHPTEGHSIASIQTQMSDGTILITNNLTPDTARLLMKLHPHLFPEPLSETTVGTSAVDERTMSNFVKAVVANIEDDEVSLTVPSLTTNTDNHLAVQATIDHNYLEMPITISGTTTTHTLLSSASIDMERYKHDIPDDAVLVVSSDTHDR